MNLRKLQNIIKRRWIPYLIAKVGKLLVRLILSTCRFHIHGLKEFIEVAERNPCILMLWHDRLVIIAEVVRKYVPQFVYTAFISKSFDGEVMAILTQSYKFGRVIRVPHNARHLALAQMIHYLKAHREIAVITPDGPKGPQYIVKPGIALAAKKTNACIVPFHWSASRYWCLKTWDKLMIPKPFSKICIYFGEAISLLKHSGNHLTDEVAILQQSMNEIKP